MVTVDRTLAHDCGCSLGQHSSPNHLQWLNMLKSSKDKNRQVWWHWNNFLVSFNSPIIKQFTQELDNSQAWVYKWKITSISHKECIMTSSNKRKTSYRPFTFSFIIITIFSTINTLEVTTDKKLNDSSYINSTGAETGCSGIIGSCFYLSKTSWNNHHLPKYVLLE